MATKDFSGVFTALITPFRRGGVDDDHVVGLHAARAPLRLRQLPDLADCQQLPQPRGRGGDVAEGRARSRDLARVLARPIA